MLLPLPKKMTIEEEKEALKRRLAELEEGETKPQSCEFVCVVKHVLAEFVVNVSAHFRVEVYMIVAKDAIEENAFVRQ